MLDLTVKRIVNVYRTARRGWSRPVSRPRGLSALVLFTEGENRYLFGERTLTARAGYLLLLPGDQPYAGVTHEEQVGYFVMDLECEPADAFTALGAPLLFAPADAELCADRLREALALWERQPLEANFRLRAILYELLGLVFAEAKRAEGRLPTDAVLRYIVENLGDPALTVEALCRRFYISESQLRRNIEKATGHTPKEYLRRLRINKARTALTETALPIQEIAAACGFASPYYFSRCFTEETGLSPRAYRKRYAAL